MLEYQGQRRPSSNIIGSPICKRHIARGLGRRSAISLSPYTRISTLQLFAIRTQLKCTYQCISSCKSVDPYLIVYYSLAISSHRIHNHRMDLVKVTHNLYFYAAEGNVVPKNAKSEADAISFPSQLRSPSDTCNVILIFGWSVSFACPQGVSI